MNKIIRMKDDVLVKQEPETQEAQQVPANFQQEFLPFVSNSLVDPTTRLLQEIRFLLVVLVILKLFCILRKKQS